MHDLTEFNIRDQAGKKQTVKILLNDNNLIICNKPSGLRSLPDFWNPDTENLMDMLNLKLDVSLKEPLEKEYALVDIERTVSGIVVYAKNKSAFNHLNNKIKLYFTAIVRGKFKSGDITVSQPIVPKSRQNRISRVDNNGFPARTTFKLMDTFKHFAVVEARCDSTLPQQIQAHLVYLNSPLAVDYGYGSPRSISISDFKRRVNYPKYEEESPAILSRTSLHAGRVVFKHPENMKEMEIVAELPKDMRAMLNVLKKWD